MREPSGPINTSRTRCACVSWAASSIKASHNASLSRSACSRPLLSLIRWKSALDTAELGDRWGRLADEPGVTALLFCLISGVASFETPIEYGPCQACAPLL